MPRILLVHPEAEVLDAIADMLRAVAPSPLLVECAPSLADGLRRARMIEPDVVFLDITADRTLLLHTVRELAAPERLIVGLYNPLVLHDDLSFLRDVTRAGVGDFIPLPASEVELAAAVASSELRREPAPAEGQIIAFFSQQGGVGTTTLAVNTALLMAGSDEVEGTVVLCDANVQFGNAVSFAGLQADRDLADLVHDPHGGASLAACLTEEPFTRLKVLAGPRNPVEGDQITAEELTSVLVELRRRFAWTVVDTSPVLDRLTLAVMDSADKLFIVTEPVTPTVIGTARLLEVLDAERLGGDRLRVVLNKFNLEGTLAQRTVEEQIGRAVDHVVPYHSSFVTAATRGQPLATGRTVPAVEEALSAIGEDAARRGGRGSAGERHARGVLA